jgi:hypothetical protein
MYMACVTPAMLQRAWIGGSQAGQRSMRLGTKQAYRSTAITRKHMHTVGAAACIPTRVRSMALFSCIPSQAWLQHLATSATVLGLLQPKAAAPLSAYQAVSWPYLDALMARSVNCSLPGIIARVQTAGLRPQARTTPATTEHPYCMSVPNQHTQGTSNPVKGITYQALCCIAAARAGLRMPWCTCATQSSSKSGVCTTDNLHWRDSLLKQAIPSKLHGRHAD